MRRRKPLPVSRIDTADVAKRIADHSSTHYLTMVGIFNGLILGAAAVALIDILSAEGLSARTRLFAVLYWIAACLVMILIYDATNVGTLLAFWVINVLDLALPLAIAIAEFTMFVILTTIPEKAAASSELEHLAYWPWAVAAVGGLAGAFILAVRRHLNRLLADEALADVVAAYKQGLKMDFVGAFVVTGVGQAILGAALFVSEWFQQHAPPAVAAVVVVSTVVGIWNQDRARREIAIGVGSRLA